MYGREDVSYQPQNCKSGTDFENWVQRLLTAAGFDARRTGGNDNGVDIIATITLGKREYKYYIHSIFVTDSHNAYPSFAASEQVQQQIESGKHANGPFNLGRINALHNDIGSYWSKDSERAPATKYMYLSLMLLWWLRKNKELTVHEKVDKLYEIIQDQHITVDALYEDIKNRELKINTKGYFPNKV